MQKRISKVLVSLLTSLILIFSIASPILAQSAAATGTSATPGPWYNQNFGQWGSKVFDQTNPNEIFGERYTYAQVTWIEYSLTAIMLGSDITKCIASGSSGDTAALSACLNALYNKTKVASVSGGTVTSLASISNSLLQAKPASGVDYIKNTLAKAHVIPQTYAQTGAGFSTLSPIQTLWGVFRNISYAMLILVIIAMAFMIMFRVKLSPQAVVTVQSALPKIAITLILITFSYAIAGLLVDLSYVVLGIFSVAIKSIGGNAIVAGASANLNGVTPINDPVALFQQLISGNGLVSIIIVYAIFAILLLIGGLATGVGGIISFAATGPFAVAAVVISILAFVFALMILLVVFRLFWLLIKTACVTVFLIIIGPLMILFGTVSNSGGFGRWVRQLAANLAVYPTVAIMIFFAHYFFWGWFLGGSSGIAVIAPYLNTYSINWNTTSGGQAVNLPGAGILIWILGLVAAFVTLFLIPHAAKVIEAMIEGKGFDYGRAVNEATNPFGIRSLAGGAIGSFVGTQIYNPRGQARAGSTMQGTGFVPDLVNSYTARRLAKKGGSGEGGVSGGGVE